MSIWKGLAFPTLPTAICKSNISSVRVNIKWLPLHPDQVKLNFDGISKSNLGKLGIGVCIRDHYGHTLSLKSESIPDCTNMVEGLALLHGLALEKCPGFNKLHIEGELAVVINAYATRNSHSW
ncbi:hypothetical protein SUGI_0375960 [Cryptomeria japonica]|nr:hypothetical protein SUGI_0375960 [Cryptomeria japonica]